MKKYKWIVCLLALSLCLAGCAGNTDSEEENNLTQEPTTATNATPTTEPVTATETPTPEPTATPVPGLTTADMDAIFEGLKTSVTYKNVGRRNPLITQSFCADPCALVYEGRVYLYMSTDEFEYDAAGNVVENTYKNLKNVHVISSDDLANWTDHGTIFVSTKGKAAKWAGASWAPCIASKEIDGKMKFFLYFANGANGIGVLSADSPTGPFTDPVGQALVTKSTPNCSDVLWMFDPAVLVDDDGCGYLYFGGGVPEGKTANPQTARVIKLGDDMVSVEGEAVMIDAPYLFEDSGINKIGDTYYYSYCSNWNVSAEAKQELGIASAQICYMTSDNPMGPFTLQGVILKNPGDYFGHHYNNHHSLFELNGQWYICYHAQTLETAMGINKCYRSTHVDAVTVTEDGQILQAAGTYLGPEQVKYLDPYTEVQAETIGTMGGLEVTPLGMDSAWIGGGNMQVEGIQAGDWQCLYGVDFGDTPAKSFTANVNTWEATDGIIQIRIDSLKGDIVGYLPLSCGGANAFAEQTAELLTGVTGVHDLFFIYGGSGYQLDSWHFEK